jgi:hypothetical protein
MFQNRKTIPINSLFGGRKAEAAEKPVLEKTTFEACCIFYNQTNLIAYGGFPREENS